MAKPTIPDSSEPFLRDGRNSPFWIRFFEGLTAAYNGTVDGISGALASISDVWEATTGKTFTTNLIEEASAYVALPETDLVAGFNWETFDNAETTLTANRAVGSPANAQPGTWRTVYIIGNNATPRTVTFNANFKGDVPTIADVTSTKAYQLIIHCKTTSHFWVSSKRAL